MTVIVIAEAGVNHCGDIKIAKRLVDIAVTAGADIIKFQTFKAKNLVTKYAKKADYQIKTTNSSINTQYEMLANLELTETMHHDLVKYCKNKKIKFLSTPFDIESARFLNSLGLDIFKIPSGEITNYPYLVEVGSYSKKIFLSTGMSNLGEIESAVNLLISSGTKKELITVLHCNTEYPTPFGDVNLRAMKTIGKALNLKYGYSDHTCGIEVSLAAVALGATVIEKHITLDRKMEGPDHAASLEPDELISMVKSIRNIEKSLGSSRKEVSKSEKKNIQIARKSLVAKKKIKKGDFFTIKNLASKRPGNGISPMMWKYFIGKISHRSYEEDDLIEW
jgi:N,N'-diacetyllegionaminate synthase